MKNLSAFLLLLFLGLNIHSQTQISKTDKQFAVFQQNVEKWKDAYNLTRNSHVFCRVR